MKALLPSSNLATWHAHLKVLDNHPDYIRGTVQTVVFKCDNLFCSIMHICNICSRNFNWFLCECKSDNEGKKSASYWCGINQGWQRHNAARGLHTPHSAFSQVSCHICFILELFACDTFICKMFFPHFKTLLTQW